jgi:hypothetical protein
LTEAAKAHAPAPAREAAVRDAEADLAPYRGRLGAAEWQRSLAVTADRLLRDRLGLPVLEL